MGELVLGSGEQDFPRFLGFSPVRFLVAALCRLLYQLLTSAPLVARQVPVMVACNKRDVDLSYKLVAIKNKLETELCVLFFPVCTTQMHSRFRWINFNGLTMLTPFYLEPGLMVDVEFLVTQVFCTRFPPFWSFSTGTSSEKASRTRWAPLGTQTCQDRRFTLRTDRKGNVSLTLFCWFRISPHRRHSLILRILTPGSSRTNPIHSGVFFPRYHPKFGEYEIDVTATDNIMQTGYTIFF